MALGDFFAASVSRLLGDCSFACLEAADGVWQVPSVQKGDTAVNAAAKISYSSSSSELITQTNFFPS